MIRLPGTCRKCPASRESQVDSVDFQHTTLAAEIKRLAKRPARSRRLEAEKHGTTQSCCDLAGFRGVPLLEAVGGPRSGQSTRWRNPWDFESAQWSSSWSCGRLGWVLGWRPMVKTRRPRSRPGSSHVTGILSRRSAMNRSELPCWFPVETCSLCGRGAYLAGTRRAGCA